MNDRFILLPFPHISPQVDETMRNWHVKISEWIIAVMFLMVVVTTFVQIIFRYIINYSLPWADELARYCFVWLVYSGILVSLYRGEHAIVGILIDNLPLRSRRVASIVVEFLVLILFVCLTIGGIKFLELSATQYTSALRMPKWTVYLALPFCGVLMIYETLIRLFNRIFRKEVPN